MLYLNHESEVADEDDPELSPESEPQELEEELVGRFDFFLDLDFFSLPPLLPSSSTA